VIDVPSELAPRAAGPGLAFASGKRHILMTAHRRENFAALMEAAFTAVRRLAECWSDVAVVYPVRPNPNVKAMAHRIHSGHPRIRLLDPLDSEPFVAVMKASCFALTDSGGVQEKAAARPGPEGVAEQGCPGSHCFHRCCRCCRRTRRKRPCRRCLTRGFCI